ncbi:14299_t:CDS:2 [Gigaspora rosea]|nr:14299_t:CDS:2 [Gigaspora rosea]
MEPVQTNLDKNINCSNIISNCSSVIPNCSNIIPDINDSEMDSNINCNDANQNINCNDDIEETTFNGFDTAGGDVGVENEKSFTCFLSVIYQSILPNRRTAKMQQQSMDLLHRIEDATIVDFTDPRSFEKLEYLNAKINNCVLKGNDIENEELLDLPTSSLKKKTSLNSINNATSSLKEKTSLGSINGVELSLSKKESLSSIYGVVDSQDSFSDNSVPTNLVSIQYDNSTEIPSPMSIASGLSFASL